MCDAQLIHSAYLIVRFASLWSGVACASTRQTWRMTTADSPQPATAMGKPAKALDGQGKGPCALKQALQGISAQQGTPREAGNPDD